LPRFAPVSLRALDTVERPGKNVRQKAGLNREILEVSPGMMISMLRYKAEWAGGGFAVINARNTSQECSQCGRTVQKDLSVRIHRCAHCKMEVYRDVNAARNVLKRAVAGPSSGFARQKTAWLQAVAPETSSAKVAA
jgi:putative transposase